MKTWRVLAVVGFLVVIGALYVYSDARAVSGLKNGSISWVDEHGNAVTSYAMDDDLRLMVHDTALGTTRVGYADFYNVPAGTTYLNLATGLTGRDEASATSTATRTLRPSAKGYAGWDGNTGARRASFPDHHLTPLETEQPAGEGYPDPAIVFPFPTHAVEKVMQNGGIVLEQPTKRQGSLSVMFRFHLIDSYEQRVRVFEDGTSPEHGVWVPIREVQTRRVLAALSNHYSAAIAFLGDAGTVLKAHYYDGDGMTVLDTTWVMMGENQPMPPPSPTPTMSERVEMLEMKVQRLCAKMEESHGGLCPSEVSDAR